jgi:hypothetical protein
MHVSCEKNAMLRTASDGLWLEARRGTGTCNGSCWANRNVKTSQTERGREGGRGRGRRGREKEKEWERDREREKAGGAAGSKGTILEGHTT